MILALDDHIGFGKAALDVPVPYLDVLEQIAVFPLLVHNRRVGLGGFNRPRDHRQRLVVHFDQFQRLRGDLFGIRRHNRHRIAHIAHFFRRQHRPIVVDQAVNVVPRNVLMGQHGVNAWERFGFAGVDARDARVRIGGAQCASVKHPLENVIVGVLGAPRDFVQHFLRRHGMSDDFQRRQLGIYAAPGDGAFAA